MLDKHMRADMNNAKMKLDLQDAIAVINEVQRRILRSLPQHETDEVMNL